MKLRGDYDGERGKWWVDDGTKKFQHYIVIGLIITFNISRQDPMKIKPGEVIIANDRIS